MCSPRRIAALAVLAAGAARADGTAMTFFDSRPYNKDGQARYESPIYEQISLTARAPSTPDWLQDVRVVVRGWGRLALGDPIDGGRRGTGDLDAAFVEGQLLQRHLSLRAGRQLVASGALRATQLDGVTGRGLIGGAFGAEAWGGSPVVTRFETVGTNALAGGRVFWRKSFDAEIGASFVYALHRGDLARKDIALDGLYTPARNVTVSAVGQWSLADSRLEEARLAATWQPLQRLQLVVDAQRTAPDLFLDRTSIFAVFSEERRDEAGAEIVYRFFPALTLSGDFHFIDVEGGDGYRGSARATFTAARAATYGAEVRVLSQPDNGYKLARVFAIRRLRALTVTIDLDGYWLDHAINGSPRSLFASATAGWTFSQSWNAMVAGTLGTNPFFETRSEIVARLIYHFPAGGSW